jgi:glutamine amidotransferase-like protein
MRLSSAPFLQIKLWNAKEALDSLPMPQTDEHANSPRSFRRWTPVCGTAAPTITVLGSTKNPAWRWFIAGSRFLDLSPAGHQPMISADGRFVIIYNGEVYSHQPIAAELAARGYKFHGHSDTEVILNSFTDRGIELTLRMIGMFAIALWERERGLILIRNRLGIKPLYRAKFGKLFLFGSELRAHPGWNAQIDRDVVAVFMPHAAARAKKKAMIPVRRIRSNSSLCGDSHGTTVRVKRLTRMYNSTPPPHPVLGRSD